MLYGVQTEKIRLQFRQQSRKFHPKKTDRQIADLLYYRIALIKKISQSNKPL